jgi:hypothetical protein
MLKDKNTPPRCIVIWWLWNGTTFEQHELEVEPVEIAKCGKYRFFRVANPVRNPGACRKWLVAEGGTGYVLAYGANAQEVLKAARGRFQFEREGIRAADVTQYIQAHLMLLERYVGDSPGFVLPVVGGNIRVVLEPGEILVMQMI